MDIREQNVPVITDEVDEITKQNPAIQKLLDQFAEDANNKRTVKHQAEKSAATTRVAKKLTSAQIRDKIRAKEQEIVDRDANIVTEYANAQKWLDEAPNALAKATARFEKQKAELLKTQTGTKQGMESLIEFHKAEVERLTEELKNGEFEESFTDDFNQKFATIELRYAKRKKFIKEQMIDWAYNKINTTIEGNFPADQKHKRGLKEMQNDARATLEVLKAELIEAETREKMTPQEKDSGTTTTMVDKIMEKEKDLNPFDEVNMDASKEEIDAMMAGTTEVE